MKEQQIQERFERETGYGHQQVPCGIIDILTPFELIEIKNWEHFDTGIGQLFRYSIHYPDRQKRLHCFGTLPTPDKLDLYKMICTANNILLTYEDEEDDIRDTLMANVSKVFKNITNIEAELEVFNDRMSSMYQDYIRLCLDNIPLEVVERKGWDLVIKYNGYPIRYEPKDDVTIGMLKSLFEGFEYEFKDFKFNMKLMGPTSLYIKIHTTGAVGPVVEEMIKASQSLNILEVALPIIIVRDYITKQIFENLLIDQNVFVYTVTEVV